MHKKKVFSNIILLTLMLALVILFLIYTSEDPRFSGGYWEKWLISHFNFHHPTTVHHVVYLIRKAMHFLGYGVLGLLFWFYFTLWRLRWSIWLGLGATSLVAVYDEYTQSLTTFRTGKPEDILLDVCGACIVCALYWIFQGRYRFVVKKSNG
jgi:VanZ family protein